MNEHFSTLIYSAWNFLVFINLSQTLKSDVNVNFTLLKLHFLWSSSFYFVGILKKGCYSWVQWSEPTKIIMHVLI